MPVYEFQCTDHVIERTFQMSEIRDYIYCEEHRTIATRIPVPKTVHVVGTGKRSRVYQQWIGDPAECPPELRKTLSKQDMPKDKSWYRSPREYYGEEDAANRKKIIEEGKKRRLERK